MNLELDGVTKSYDGFTLGPVSLTVGGGVTAVIGPSGSGKSTLLGTIAGFTTPSAGSVRLGDRVLDGRPPEERSVGVVFQSYALFPHLTVRENLAFGADDCAAVDDCAADFEIDHLLDRKPNTLSGGEKQRVALARTLLSDPDVLLLDEPLASLDEPIRRRLRFELRETLATLDIPVVYVTHDQDEASIVADRVVILNEGRVVQRGDKEAVFSRPETAFVADFIGLENVVPGRVVERAAGRTLVDVGETTFVATGEAHAEEVCVAIHPESISLHRPAETDQSPLAARVRADGDGIAQERGDGEAGPSLGRPGDGTPVTAVEATVSQVVDHRRAQTVRLQCAGDLELVSRLRNDDAGFRAGERVLASVEATEAVLVRR